jgi:hypothetical protein
MPARSLRRAPLTQPRPRQGGPWRRCCELPTGQTMPTTRAGHIDGAAPPRRSEHGGRISAECAQRRPCQHKGRVTTDWPNYGRAHGSRQMSARACALTFPLRREPPPRRDPRGRFGASTDGEVGGDGERLDSADGAPNGFQTVEPECDGHHQQEGDRLLGGTGVHLHGHVNAWCACCRRSSPGSRTSPSHG